MEQQIRKALRMPRTIATRIERLAKAEGSTFSQFMRAAAIKELKLRSKAA